MLGVFDIFKVGRRAVFFTHSWTHADRGAILTAR